MAAMTVLRDMIIASVISAYLRNILSPSSIAQLLKQKNKDCAQALKVKKEMTYKQNCLLLF